MELEKVNKFFDGLSENDVDEILLVIKVISFKLELSHPPHIIYIPYGDFPDNFGRFKINQALQQLKGLGVLNYTNVVGAKPPEQEIEVRIADDKKNFLDFQDKLEKKSRELKPKAPVLPQTLSGVGANVQIISPWDEELSKRAWENQKEMERSARDGWIRMNERRSQEALQRKQFKYQRILNCKEDKRVHALSTIIERLEPFYPEQKNISVDYHYFNYEDRMDDSHLLEKFLKEASAAGCFQEFRRSNYAGGTRFGFIEVNLEKLKDYRDKLKEKLRPQTVPAQPEPQNSFWQEYKRKQTERDRIDESRFERRISREREERDTAELIRIQRIAASGKPPLIYTMERIIEKCLIDPKADKIEIDFYSLGFEGNLMEACNAHRFFNQLKDAGCFGSVDRVNNTWFVVTKPDIKRLKVYKSRLEGEITGDKVGDKKNFQESDKKFPHKFPAGKRWEDIIIKFLTEEDVVIIVPGLEQCETNYKEMGFEDKRNSKPNSQWNFLKILAKNVGELSWDNSEAEDKFKKHKERLTKLLWEYFPLDYDPFFPYVEKKSYKIKITLIPPPEDKELEKSDDLHDEIEELMRSQVVGGR